MDKTEGFPSETIFNKISAFQILLVSLFYKTNFMFRVINVVIYAYSICLLSVSLHVF